MSLRTILARLRGPWVTEDPNPQHSRPAASTYPTRRQVSDAIDRATTTAGITSVHPGVKARIVDEVAAIWEADAYARYDDAPTFVLPSGECPPGVIPNDGTRGLTGKHERTADERRNGGTW